LTPDNKQLYHIDTQQDAQIEQTRSNCYFRWPNEINPFG
jgi:hypothetical protein